MLETVDFNQVISENISVVAENMCKNGFACFASLSAACTDLNELLKPGIYIVDSLTKANLASEATMYSILINYSASGSASIQVLFVRDKNLIMIRSEKTNVWGEWTNM